MLRHVYVTSCPSKSVPATQNLTKCRSQRCGAGLYFYIDCRTTIKAHRRERLDVHRWIVHEGDIDERACRVISSSSKALHLSFRSFLSPHLELAATGRMRAPGARQEKEEYRNPILSPDFTAPPMANCENCPNYACGWMGVRKE